MNVDKSLLPSASASTIKSAADLAATTIESGTSGPSPGSRGVSLDARQSRGGAAAGVRRGAIKGAAFREFLRWYASNRPEHLAEAVSGLAPDLRNALDLKRESLGLISTDWYSCELIHGLLDAITSDLPPAEARSIIFEAARSVTRSTMLGVHRGLNQILESPERYAKHAPRLWEAYYGTGQFQVCMNGPNDAVAAIEQWDMHHPFLCLLVWGGITSVYESMGCAEVRVERRTCVAQGGENCQFAIRWSV